MHIQFGGKISKSDVARYQQSKHWIDGSFKNLEETSVSTAFYKIPGIICKQIKGNKFSAPNAPLPVFPFEKAAFLQPSDSAGLIWYGHSAVLMRLGGKTILIDPMLGPDTSPIAPVTTRRFSENTLDLIDVFPEIDLVLLSHDHYDHLDYQSISRLKLKTRQYFVALGLKRHLVAWGIAPNLITEFDWWDHHTAGEVEIHYTPTRHFSGRGLTDRAKSLWGGWALRTPRENIWFSGDSGYGLHFGEIGKRLGPFDLGLMECGQYSDDWPQIHMFPPQSVQAALDAGAKTVMPVHWAGFSLSYSHAWFEPVEHFKAAAEACSLPCITPRLGELFNPGMPNSTSWWEHHK